MIFQNSRFRQRMAIGLKTDAKIDRFRGPKSRKIDEKLLLKFISFLISFLKRFCVDFRWDFEGFGAARVTKKREK